MDAAEALEAPCDYAVIVTDRGDLFHADRPATTTSPYPRILWTTKDKDGTEWLNEVPISAVRRIAWRVGREESES